MSCSICQANNPPHARFCSQCGSPLKRCCPRCRTEVLPAARFCHACGDSLNPVTPPVPSGGGATSPLPWVPPGRPVPAGGLPPRETAATPGAAGPTESTLELALPGGGRELSPGPSDTGRAERRQLTVIFSDLVSFTQLSQQLDPEDLNSVVHEYYAVCRAVCQRYEGHVANYLGDGVLMYFGYPQAHEDDAHRAVRTALAIVEGVGALNERLARTKGIRLRVRAGVHTGLMIVGDDRAGNWQQMALGETLNIASRVQAVAEPDSAVVSASTQHLVEGFFAMRSVGEHTLKGVAQPVEVFVVLQETTARGRLEAAGRSGLTDLSGRDSEVALLLEEWRQARDGKGRAVLITGDGGIGKSRLVQTLKEHVATVPGAWLTPCQCSPYHRSTSMYPFIDLIERVVLRFERQESPRERLNKLEGMLVQYGFHAEEALPVFATFHSLPPEAGYTPPALEPRELKRRYMDAMRRILVERSRKQPLLFVVEDLHWIDPTSLAVLSEIVDEVEGLRMMALFTARPEFESPWAAHSRLRTIPLMRLDRAQTSQVCRSVAHGKRLPKVVLEQILDRAGGVPLFAEELTKMVVESGQLLEQGDAYELAGAMPALAIPATLQDSLMARLDRLSAVKEIAQIASVIGDGFRFELLQGVYPLEERVLRHSLDQLVDSELLQRSGGPGNPVYTFKHALLREAAYQSLTKRRRQKYHRLVAEALEEKFPEAADAEPEMLAHHYAEANLGWQAVPYLRRAGEKASGRSSHREAIAHFESALAILRTLADGTSRRQLEMSLAIALGAALTATRGYGSAEVERTYARARELAEQCGTPGQLFQARYGLWRLHMLRAQYDLATREAEELLELADRQENRAFRIAAHRALGSTLFYRGQWRRSLSHLEHVLADTDTGDGEDRDRFLRDIYDVVDPRVTCRSYRAWIYWMLGRCVQARAEALEAMALADRLGHPFSRALALSFATWLEQFRGDAVRVTELAKAAIALSRDHGFHFWVGWGQVLEGWALATRAPGSGDPVGRIREGLKAWQEKGSDLGRGYFMALLAETHLRRGEGAEAREALAQSQAFARERDERYWDAERQRLAAEVEAAFPGAHGDGPGQAESVDARLQEAIRIACEQEARSLELRARNSLARHRLRTGRASEADPEGRLAALVASLGGEAERRDLEEALGLLARLGR